MKNLIKTLIITLSVLIFASQVDAAPLSGNAKTRRIPAGTKLQFELLNTIATYATYQGADFSAKLIADQKIENSIILPAGSIVRGTVNKVKPAKMLSRGAVLYIDFDHVVTPNGRQLPLSLALYNYKKQNFEGGIYNSLGYGEALQNNWAKTVDITKGITKTGVDAGDAFVGAKIITVPFCALGGGIAGGAYLFGDSIADIFRKGEDVILKKGEIITVTLKYPIDIPVN
ncbi:MAG: hypothetical protein MJ229_02290 [bacterium]|nr:hypothetical protein [bacterium]